MSREPAELLDLRPAAPFDRRLLTLDPRSVRIVAWSALLQAATVLAVILQAVYFGHIVANAVHGRTLGPSLSDLPPLAVASFAIAALTFVRERLMSGIAGRIKADLRRRLIGAAADVDQGPSGFEQAARTMLLATKGLEDLEAYMVGFIPAATYAVVAPLAVIAYSALTDPLSALIEVGTMAAIPPLMIVLGRTAGEKAQEKWQSLQRLSAQFVESVAAIGTIKGIGAERRQEGLIRSASEQLRKATMSTLYLAFISSGVLEVVTTVAIALVAVSIGIRLADGSTTFAPSVSVLILVPVAYLAVRNASVQFHTTTDARTALDWIFAGLERGGPPTDAHRGPGAPRPLGARLELQGVGITRNGTILLEGITAGASPGERLYLLGPSGSGKSTLCRALAGLILPSQGRILFGGFETGRLTGSDLSRLVAYLPQDPTFFEASLLDNILVGRESPAPQLLEEVLAAVGLDRVVAGLPGGLEYRLSEFGDALSAGERQRVALARALIHPKPLMILDEPTSHLDFTAEAEVWPNILARSSDSVLVFAAHRSRLAASATITLELRSGGSEDDEQAG
ncbi:MAG: ATP-binding cassette domain-containing protein [Actinomycetota bacterium]|nr:ATP-binding cassette domain-containing protein [Actinomycetota bacterium]